uniref:HTH-type transcriptional regulator / antitoxin HigA n=1 Tax=Candidatus Kentrum sp. FM TaxID=2126340 RepID=A0A450SGK0_9GAMM|nr:MAG: HTH-type transcriptional regulator / antitoxin HigA [Candidatus Kentron sp. FM]VFJ52192.1 MAG: HTH-type transcriptional regulator / antitoxin HigA [Candidatus Kentron sp. FM]VFK09139.1 MAG: HTH-type transcriptional regulator / antitoxin HigA [Candidatus Kentron sp. FM]
MNVAVDSQRLIRAWLALRSVAPVSHIESEGDYEQATALLNGLLDIVRDDANHPLYSLVSVVGDLIEAYEIGHESPSEASPQTNKA